MRPLQTLFAELIDYAGLFPPAGLDMQPVVANYADYLKGPQSWMLGRLVAPVARLAEFTSAWQSHGPSPTGVRLSALTRPLDAPDGGFVESVRAIESFNSQAHGHVIDAVEVRVSDPGAVGTACELPNGIRCFIEVPVERRVEVIAAIAQLGEPQRFFGKIRTGGVTADLIPPPESVGAFIAECRAAEIGFKATAGLHHPFRDRFPLTYEEGCDEAPMHGFVSVFLGASLLHAGKIDLPELVTLLSELQAGDVTVQEDRLAWRAHSIDSASIAVAREKFVLSFGSCSFTEPVEDLRSYGLLPETPNATS